MYKGDGGAEEKPHIGRGPRRFWAVQASRDGGAGTHRRRRPAVMITEAPGKAIGVVQDGGDPKERPRTGLGPSSGWVAASG